MKKIFPRVLLLGLTVFTFVLVNGGGLRIDV